MKFRKSLIAAMLTGAGVIAVAPAINAAEYSTSVSGNIRVEGTSSTKDGVTTSVTSFGGEDDEASTGGDTFLQWNHNFANDEGTTTGGGFLRFAADGNIRINVHARSEFGNYVGELKAEWEQIGFSGLNAKDSVVSRAQTGRDQFAKLTHTPSGVYYKIGRGIGLLDASGNPVKDDAGNDATVAPAAQSADTRFLQLHLAFPVSGGQYDLGY